MDNKVGQISKMLFNRIILDKEAQTFTSCCYNGETNLSKFQLLSWNFLGMREFQRFVRPHFALYTLSLCPIVQTFK